MLLSQIWGDLVNCEEGRRYNGIKNSARSLIVYRIFTV